MHKNQGEDPTMNRPLGRHAATKTTQGLFVKLRGKARDGGLPWTPACLVRRKVTPATLTDYRSEAPPPPHPVKHGLWQPLVARGAATCCPLRPTPAGPSKPSGTAGDPRFPGAPSG